MQPTQSTSEYNEGRFKRSKVYAKVAAQEFGLTKDQQQELYEKKSSTLCRSLRDKGKNQ